MIETMKNMSNRITMYQGINLSLMLLVVMGIVYAATGVLSVSATGIALSLLVAGLAGCSANQIFSRLRHVPGHTQAWLTTALILTLILPPITSWQRAGLVAATAVIAMASKYVLVWRGANIFNPAGIAAVVVSAFGILPVTWWVANPSLLPFIVVGGLITLYKHRLFGLFMAFAIPAAGLLLIDGIRPYEILASWPLLFLGTVMLTEPTTVPVKQLHRIIYGALVGCLFSVQASFGPLSMSPHLALIIGNLVGFALAPHISRVITMRSRRQLAPGIYEMTFDKPSAFTYQPGQYADWTIFDQTPDGRGNRRTFSLASSPTESDLRIAYRTPAKPSPVKVSLNAMKHGDALRVSTIAGSFTPPSDNSPLLLIAGGIGITPFRSIAAAHIDSEKERDVMLYYYVRSVEDAVYGDVLKKAAAYGWQTKLFVDTPAAEHFADVPLLPDRTVMISGAPGMVDTVTKLVKQAGVKRRNIKTDSFAGY